MNFQSHTRLALMARTARTKALRLEQARVRQHMETCETCRAQRDGRGLSGLADLIKNALQAGDDVERHVAHSDTKPKAH